ncbi:ribonuclease E/G [Pseudogemmobacter sp. W21_MBD1_M6]|uniref:ribonuclease E/G n=1 Tax=Pseudogemmobacter sp. W21_MBD1_M6 TaxID=3240271 RepID=UPI003F96217A
MAKKMLIDATHAEETRVVVVDGNKVEEFDFESENKRQIAGNIYLAKVTRVEPSLQAAFVDYGGNRHGFLAFSEVHPDYYQIPVADREALMAEEREYVKSLQDAEDEPKSSRSRGGNRSRSRSSSKAETAQSDDAVEVKDADAPSISGMDVVDFGNDDDAGDNGDHSSRDDHATDDHDNEEDTQVSSDPSDRDDEIESIADEDVAEEIRQPRKPRARKYKIQEVIKVRQILLVQVVKEERGNKGAALTTYLSLAGRYCVLMPNTARGGGISRKITNAVDRKKLKEIANEIDVPDGAGLIIRTAGSQRTKTEIKRDYEYLQRLWEQIRELTLKSIAPAKIYEEGDLIKRSIRDLYNRDIDEVFVEGAEGYRIAKDFMKMIMPSHAVNVKQYRDTMPLFARFQVESYLAGMFNPTVQLKSGGYIVIGVTEALVAIDVNSGRATKEGSIEETATKTNLEAAEEVARQLRLRDLAGLIVIDFIDMEDRRNNAAVEKRFKDKLKTDRARIQVGRISGFGLMEMSRQRLRPGMIEATTQPCSACHGTGLIRSDDNLALNIIRQLEEEGVRKRSREVLLKAPVAVVNFLMNNKREHIAQIEARYGMSVRVEADPHLISPDFTIEKFKTATRVVPEISAHIVSVDSSLMDEIDEDMVEDAVEVDEAEAAEETPVEVAASPVAATEEGDAQAPKKRRRRRRRRKPGNGQNGDQSANGDQSDDDSDEAEDGAEEVAAQTSTPEATPAAVTESGETPTGDAVAQDAPAAKKTARRTRSTASKSSSSTTKAPAAKAPAKPRAPSKAALAKAKAAAEAEVNAEAGTEAVAATDAPAPKKRASRSRATKAKAPVASEAVASEAVASEAVAIIETSEAPAVPAPAPVAVTPERAEPAAKLLVPDTAPETVTEAPVPEPQEPASAVEPEKVEDTGPKKRGWWSLGR